MKRPVFSFSLAAAVILACDILACDKAAPNQPESNPAWLDQLIAQIQSQPVTVPPTAIYRYTYRGETVYYRTSRCCDIRSVLYDFGGAVICEPDGGIDSGGDGRCPDFLATRTGERLIFQDSRTN
jgi:Domain of unknown function (DUF6970)